MCTVTFLPLDGRILIASNRDEKRSRSSAIEPRRYRNHSGNVLYPRDADAGGTWIALHENGNAIVFLNGGFDAHTSRPPYARSRGLVLLDLIGAPSPKENFSSLELGQIEPFTAVIWEKGELLECVWDGAEKHMTVKDPGVPHIWSSSTLYEDDVRAWRRQWYDDWLKQVKAPGLEDLLYFHRFTGSGDDHNGLLISRSAHSTVSITGIELEKDMGSMTYLDLKNNREHREMLPIVES